jgi:hypothetical protein
MCEMDVGCRMGAMTKGEPPLTPSSIHVFRSPARSRPSSKKERIRSTEDQDKGRHHPDLSQELGHLSKSSFSLIQKKTKSSTHARPTRAASGGYRTCGHTLCIIDWSTALVPIRESSDLLFVQVGVTRLLDDERRRLDGVAMGRSAAVPV